MHPKPEDEEPNAIIIEKSPSKGGDIKHKPGAGGGGGGGANSGGASGSGDNSGKDVPTTNLIQLDG